MRPLKHKAATATDTNLPPDVAGGSEGSAAPSQQGAAAAVATPSAAAPQHDNINALQQRVEEAERAQQLVQMQLAQMQQQQQAPQQLSPAKALFLEEHPEADVNQLGHLHNKAIQELKLADDSPEYFRFIKAAIQPQQVDEPIAAPQRAPPKPAAPMARHVEIEPEHVVPSPREREAPQRDFVVSAPTSREAMSMNTGRAMSASNKIRLSPSQVEAAKIAGVSLETYAKGVLQLERDKLLNPDKYGTRG